MTCDSAMVIVAAGNVEAGFGFIIVGRVVKNEHAVHDPVSGNYNSDVDAFNQLVTVGRVHSVIFGITAAHVYIGLFKRNESIILKAVNPMTAPPPAGSQYCGALSRNAMTCGTIEFHGQTIGRSMV